MNNCAHRALLKTSKKTPSFPRKRESILVQTVVPEGPWMPDQVRHDDFVEFLEAPYIFRIPRELAAGADEVITDTIPVNKKRQAVEKGVQLALAKFCQNDRGQPTGLWWAAERLLSTPETSP